VAEWVSGPRSEAQRREADVGEPIFAENWRAPTGLESRFGSRHAGPVETSPSNARDHGATFRTANSDACGSVAEGEDRSSATVRRTTNSGGGTADWLASDIGCAVPLTVPR
jgi:hypothetical protein